MGQTRFTSSGGKSAGPRLRTTSSASDRPSNDELTRSRPPPPTLARTCDPPPAAGPVWTVSWPRPFLPSASRTNVPGPCWSEPERHLARPAGTVPRRRGGHQHGGHEGQRIVGRDIGEGDLGEARARRVGPVRRSQQHAAGALRRGPRRRVRRGRPRRTRRSPTAVSRDPPRGTRRRRWNGVGARISTRTTPVAADNSTRRPGSARGTPKAESVTEPGGGGVGVTGSGTSWLSRSSCWRAVRGPSGHRCRPPTRPPSSPGAVAPTGSTGATEPRSTPLCDPGSRGAVRACAAAVPTGATGRADAVV